MNEARLREIDKLLRKDWQSYYDIAKVIHESFVSKKQYGKLIKWEGEVTNNDCYYDALLIHYRPSISHDILDIPDIWAYSHRRQLSKKGKSTVEKNQIRAEAKEVIFDIKEDKEFKSREDPELFIKAEKRFRDNPTVQYFKYKNPNYSLFDSGDFEIFIKKSAESRSIRETVDQETVNCVLNDTDVVLDEVVSDQIRRSILIQKETREFAQESRNIVESFIKDISTKSEHKKRNWFKKTVNKYKNILELVKNPLSNYNPREIADHIHEFAFFLATENQYHLLGDRFDEALSIYQKLRREQRHILEDIEQGLVTVEEADIDVQQTKEQIGQDDESVAAILLSTARVRLDSGEIEKAKTALVQAESLSRESSLVRAQICHLKSILANIEGDTDAAINSIDEADGIIHALSLEESADGQAIMASKANLLQRLGNVTEAKTIYESLLTKDYDEEDAREVQTSAHLNLAILNLSAGQIDEADMNVSEAIKGFEKLFANEPDRILPTLLSAKYIKSLVLMHQGDIEASATILEEASTMLPERRPDLQDLCASELLEIYVTLHGLYKAMNKSEKVDDIAPKVQSLLASPTVYLTEEQKNTILSSLDSGERSGQEWTGK